ncbi:MAG: hypothetical protein F6K09_05820 [Merismopedia sp. SIO2A8]|nr:hypothetical protein [Merismopedia sp. SIO2A8]
MPLDVPMRFETEPLLRTVDGVYSPPECEEVIRWIDANIPALATNNSMYHNQDPAMRTDVVDGKA